VQDHNEAFVAFDTSKLHNAVAIAESGRTGEFAFSVRSSKRSPDERSEIRGEYRKTPHSASLHTGYCLSQPQAEGRCEAARLEA